MAAEETFGRRDFLKRSAGIGVGVLGSSILFGCNPDWYNQMQVNEAEKESLLEKRICTSWKQIASLNIPRQHFGGVETEKGIILAFGGLDPEHNVLDSTEMYTPNTNNWVYIKQKLNVPRYYFRATGTGDRIYAISGLVNPNGELTETVEMFDLRSFGQGWRFVAPVNTPRGGAQVVSSHNKIYSISGLAEGNNPVNTVESYDPENDRWDYIEGLNLPRAFFGAGVDLKGRIYVFGGDCSSDRGRSFYHTDTTEMFDPTKPEKGWRFVAPLSEAKSVGASASVGNFIFCLGGWKDYEHVSKVEVYDARNKRRKWTYHSDMLTPRNHFVAPILDNQLYAIGGDGTSFLSINDAERTTQV